MSDDLKRLADISRRIKSILKLCKTAGGIYEAIEDFECMQPAIIMHLVVCNKDVGKLLYSDIDIRAILGEYNMRGLKAVRNITAHNYDGLDLTIIHDIISEFLPEIMEKIDTFLQANHSDTMFIDGVAHNPNDGTDTQKLRELHTADRAIKEDKIISTSDSAKSGSKSK